MKGQEVRAGDDDGEWAGAGGPGCQGDLLGLLAAGGGGARRVMGAMPDCWQVPGQVCARDLVLLLVGDLLLV